MLFWTPKRKPVCIHISIIYMYMYTYMYIFVRLYVCLCVVRVSVNIYIGPQLRALHCIDSRKESHSLTHTYIYIHTSIYIPC